jgi:hypothetical protein
MPCMYSCIFINTCLTFGTGKQAKQVSHRKFRRVCRDSEQESETSTIGSCTEYFGVTWNLLLP